SGKSFRAGGYVGDALASLLSAYLNRTGSIILILTLFFLAIILSTQFSFGRLFSAIFQLAHDRWTAMLAAMRERREEKRRDKQRQEVLKKHLAKEGKESKGGKDTPQIERPATREKPITVVPPPDAPARCAFIRGRRRCAQKAVQ